MRCKLSPDDPLPHGGYIDAGKMSAFIAEPFGQKPGNRTVSRTVVYDAVYAAEIERRYVPNEMSIDT